jgi:multicomponent Na+:H+ antiporter subunit A
MMFLLILSGFVLSLFAPFIHLRYKRIAPFLLSLYPLLLFIYFLSQIQAVGIAPVSETYQWVPLLGINFSFYLDGLSLVFALLISGIGFLVMLYAAEYMKHDLYAHKFYLFFLLFMSSMIGLVLSSNLVILFIFWELTSISSFFLIGHKHKDSKARKAALQALLITAGGGLLLLAGVVLIGTLYGTYEFSEMLLSPDLVRDGTAYTAVLLLFAAGAFTKSAQVPFHFWLPNAMSAPTPVSAYLHSATMVKAGVFLLLRMTPILGGTELWHNLLVIFGTLTMLTGALLSVFQLDLKKILAYSTISSLGTLVMLTGIGAEYAIKAAIVFLVVHSLYKGAFFLIAGSIDHLTGTRNISKIRGLGKLMPALAVAGILAVLSNSGIPPLFGFVGKELIYEAALAFGEGSYLFIGLAIVSNILLVIAGLNAGLKPFIGKKAVAPKIITKTPFALWFGPCVLGFLSLTLGLFPTLIAGPLFTPAVSAILNEVIEVKLELWHGFNVVLFLSALTVAMGFGLYLMKLYRFKQNKYLFYVTQRGPESWYNLGFRGLLKFARLQTQVIQNGYLRNYLLTIIIVLATLVFSSIFYKVSIPQNFYFKNILIYEGIIVLTILIGISVVVYTQSRLTAIASLGLIGYSLALLFVLYGAPDIAMTQFTIDTLTVILFVLILWKLPQFLPMSPNYSRIRDLIIVLFMGGLISFLVLMVISNPSDSDLRVYFAENSYLLAHGRNVVNVILVDFRSLDTFIEITVLAVAAIGVYALLKLKK